MSDAYTRYAQMLGSSVQETNKQQKGKALRQHLLNKYPMCKKCTLKDDFKMISLEEHNLLAERKYNRSIHDQQVLGCIQGIEFRFCS